MRILGLIVLVLGLGGCVDADEAAGQGTTSGIDDQAIGARSLDPDHLLRNDEVIGFDTGEAEVQALLDHYGSALASYREDGKLAARWIVDAARASDLSATYLVARIETESGLIRSGTLRNLSAATGCGCPDGASCDPQHAGFGLQVRCAAEKIRGYLDSLAATGATISGWRVGAGKSTLDPCWVVPANEITAALYTYTPWVGAYALGCGTARWGGSSLVALLTRRFAQDLEDLDCEPPVATEIVVDSDDGQNDPARARAELPSSWTQSHYTPGYYGTGYAYAGVQAVADGAVLWFHLDREGDYEIEAWWTAGGNRSSATPFVVFDGTGARQGVAYADQTTAGSRWNSLGRFRLTSGWNRVVVSRWAADGTVVVADAIRVTR